MQRKRRVGPINYTDPFYSDVFLNNLKSNSREEFCEKSERFISIFNLINLPLLYTFPISRSIYEDLKCLHCYNCRGKFRDITLTVVINSY